MILNFSTDSEFESLQAGQCVFQVCKPSCFTCGKGGNEEISICFVERVVLFGKVKSWARLRTFRGCTDQPHLSDKSRGLLKHIAGVNNDLLAWMSWCQCIY